MAVPSRRPVLLCHAGGRISLPAITACLSARPGRDPGAPAAGLALLRLPCSAVLPAHPRQGLRFGLARSTPKACVFWFAPGLVLLVGLNPVRMSAGGFCRRQPGRGPIRQAHTIIIVALFCCKVIQIIHNMAISAYIYARYIPICTLSSPEKPTTDATIAVARQPLGAGFRRDTAAPPPRA